LKSKAESNLWAIDVVHVDLYLKLTQDLRGKLKIDPTTEWQ